MSPSNTALPSPWNEFLAEIDNSLAEPLELHCIGGFVLVHFYEFPRATADIDYYTAVPNGYNLEEIAGHGSPLHTKYKVWLHRVTATILPSEYESRLTELAPGTFKALKLLVPDPYDCILSKLERNSPKDREDVEHLFSSQKLDCAILEKRYAEEFRPYLLDEARPDVTFKLWIENFQQPPE